MEIDKALVSVHKFSERMPVVSTVTNLVGLFQKYVTIPYMKEGDVSKNHYYSYLYQKGAARCVVLLIPLLGNILVAIHDFVNRYSDKEYVLKTIKEDYRGPGYVFDRASKDLQKDKEILLALVMADGLELGNANIPKDQKDDELVLAAVKSCGRALQYGNLEQKKNAIIVLSAVKQDAFALQDADPILQDKEEIVLPALKQNGDVLPYANPRFQNILQIVLLAVSTAANPTKLIACLSKVQRDNEEIILAGLKNRHGIKTLKYASYRLQNNKKIVEAAIRQHGRRVLDGTAVQEKWNEDKELVAKIKKEHCWYSGADEKIQFESIQDTN